jgi:hypothetical protein
VNPYDPSIAAPGWVPAEMQRRAQVEYENQQKVEQMLQWYRTQGFSTRALKIPGLPEPRKLEPLPTRKVEGGITAYRGWNVERRTDGYILRSVAALHVAWPGPTLVADKVPEDNRAVGITSLIAGPGHGVHAFKSVTELMKPGGYTCQIWGEVLLWGRVVVHERGYRAERAMIRRIVVPPAAYVAHKGLIKDLEGRYGVEVTTDFTTLLKD